MRVWSWIAVLVTLKTVMSAGMAWSVPGPSRSDNSGTVTIDDPSAYSAVYALSDVHGMDSALKTLLTENGLMNEGGHWAGSKSLLLVVGDSIDKGAHSIEVLDRWIQLQAEAEAAGGRIIHLLGNHEAEFLADPTPSDDKAKALFDELKARGIPVEQLSQAQYPRGHFLRSEPLAARVGNWLFCHAGYLPDQAWKEFSLHAASILQAGDYGNKLLIDDSSILEAKKWWQLGSDTRAQLEARLDREGFAGVVFGHQPKALNVAGQSAVSEDGRLMKIDNGMAPEAGSHPGSLLLFPNPSELKGPRPRVFALIHGERKELPAENREELGD